MEFLKQAILQPEGLLLGIVIGIGVAIFAEALK